MRPYLRLHIFKQELVKLYLEEKQSASQIAKKLGCTDGAIYLWLKKYQIPIRSKSEAIHLNHANHVVLSQEARSFVYGELLGDGYVCAHSNYSAEFSLSSQYLKYVQWLSKQFLNYGIHGVPVSPKGSKSRDTTIFQFHSHSFVELKPIRELFYPSGKKIIPRSLKLDPLMIRQWFIGDGSLKHGERGRPHIRLATDGFTPEDVEFGSKRDEHFIGIESKKQEIKMARASDHGTWRAVYKCRRCGEFEKDLLGGHAAIMQGVIHAVIGVPMSTTVGTPPQLLSTHHCKDGGIGVSDLIGGEKKEDSG